MIFDPRDPPPPPDLDAIDRRLELGDGGPASQMSLRDYFAAHCGLVIQFHAFRGPDGKIEPLDPGALSLEATRQFAAWKARLAYQIADALLAARKL